MTKSNTPDAVFTMNRDFISRFTNLSPHQLDVAAVFVMHTWQFSESCPGQYTTPYLYVNSPQKGSGKSRFGIEVLDLMVRNPQSVANTTEATIFRMIESLSPTLLIDEVDTIFDGKRNSGLVGVLNVGYKKGAKVPRTEGNEVRMFDTFCPKVLIGIDNSKLTDTTRDRCIPINMQRATPEELSAMDEFEPWEVEDDREPMAERNHAWAIQNGMAIRDYKPERVSEFSARQWEICRPLLQLARIANVFDRVLEALTVIFTEAARPENTPEQDMLIMIRDEFTERGTDRMFTQDVIDVLATDPRFAGLSQKGLGFKLSPFGIHAGSIRIGNENKKGFKLSQFSEAFSRYI